eukprot:CAMPEP_0206303254 /NCGR_PEP_ID=MMETSP0106_2-20121207/9141_1 /ASSEMBLY_ACC=CAM_ASM_000206 /TAXON_ID=81532 /ORGANISM="Acanthoeca-like sp., Strain 10tr" /LENGTH=1189 /DNA_ID=CAMNT_0053734041 /DNA_START=42 /DNA_END=3611 /DNA_ORIENTATION=+
MFSSDPGVWFGKQHSSKNYLRWASFHLSMARWLGTYGLLSLIVIGAELALSAVALLASRGLGTDFGWRFEDAVFRGVMLFVTWVFLIEVYVDSCSVRMTRYTGANKFKLTRPVFKQWPRGVNRLYDCIRPGFLLAHMASGAVIAYHVTVLTQALIGVGARGDRHACAPLAARTAELGGLLGLAHAATFVWHDRFYLVADPVQPRSRLKRLLAHVRQATYDALWSAARRHGPLLLAYSAGTRIYRWAAQCAPAAAASIGAGLASVANSTAGPTVAAAVPISGLEVYEAVTVGMAKVFYGTAATATAMFVYMYLCDIAPGARYRRGPFALIPDAVVTTVLDYPMLLAAVSAPLTFFFLEDLGADDVGPVDVARTFLRFVQTPVSWMVSVATGQADLVPAHFAPLNPPDLSLGYVVEACALGFVVCTVALATWSTCYKLAEMMWTQPPDKSPTDEDLVATLQTDLDDGSLAPARQLAFAVLSRRLLAVDETCGALFATRSHFKQGELSHWEKIVDVCIKVLYDMYYSADALGADKADSTAFYRENFYGRPLETYTDSQLYGKIRGKGWEKVNTTMLTRHHMDRNYGQGYAVPGWGSESNETARQPRQEPPRRRVVPPLEAAMQGIPYGAMLGAVYPMVLRPLSFVHNSLVSGLMFAVGSLADTGPADAPRELLGAVIGWVDPTGSAPLLTDVLVGAAFGALVGALWGVWYIHWWTMPPQPGELTVRAWIDWWMLAFRAPRSWFRPDLSEAEAITRLQGQADQTFIVHRDDAPREAGKETYRIKVTRDGTSAPAPAAPGKGGKKPKKKPSKHSASFWSGTIELVPRKGFVLVGAPPKQPAAGRDYLNKEWEVHYDATIEGLVAYYAAEPYEYVPEYQLENKLLDFSKPSPLFETWHQKWFERKKSAVKEWLKSTPIAPVKTCLICRAEEAKVEYTCAPCGHKAVCNKKECADAVLRTMRCPRCKKEVDEIMNAGRASALGYGKNRKGWRQQLHAALFVSSIDDKRRETFSDFQAVIAAVRCLAEGLATANALPTTGYGNAPEPRDLVLRSVFIKGEQNIVWPYELEWDPDTLDERDIQQLPRVVKALLRMQEGVIRQRENFSGFSEGGCPDDEKVDTHAVGARQVVDKLPLEVFISAIPTEYYGCLAEIDLALNRILWHFSDQRPNLESEFRRTDPYASKRFQLYVDRENRLA